jgi:hypothetical protein
MPRRAKIDCMLRSIVACLMLLLPLATATAPRVVVMETPSQGIQPQAVVDRDGVLHLIYFTGDPAHGDLYYVQRRPGQSTFSRPVRVNSEPATVLAVGSIRGGQLATGRDGWIHAAWHSTPRVKDGLTQPAPMWYSRMSASAHEFEPQRAIGQRLKGMDGDSIAADRRGNVYIVWHAAGDVEGEAHRRVYAAQSHDDGAHFDPDRAIAETGGACGCCGLRAAIDGHDRLNVLYRAATDDVHRDATWVSVGAAGPSAPVRLHAWELRACPMSLFAIAPGGGMFAAWETAQQIYYATLDPDHMSASAPVAVAGTAARRLPSVAVNHTGDRLLAWTEGTAWARGGTLAWELQNAHGATIASASRAGAVPVWGLVSAAALPDGSFVIVR